MLRRVSSAVAALRNPKGSSGTIALSASGTLRLVLELLQCRHQSQGFQVGHSELEEVHCRRLAADVERREYLRDRAARVQEDGSEVFRPALVDVSEPALKLGIGEQVTYTTPAQSAADGRDFGHRIRGRNVVDSELVQHVGGGLHQVGSLR